MKHTKIGVLLKDWRDGEELSQNSAAILVGVSQGRWGNWERGIEQPGAGAIARIVEVAMGKLTLEQLFAALTPKPMSARAAKKRATATR